MDTIKFLLNTNKKSNNTSLYLLIPFIVIIMVKYSKTNYLKYNQTCKKRWARQIFSYLRDDKEMIEEINNDKVFFFKKNSKKNSKKNIKKICGLQDFSSINIKKLPVYTMEEAIKMITKMFEQIKEWCDLKTIIPKNFLKNKKLKKSGMSGTFAASLELVREGKLLIKQDRIFEDIFIKSKI